MLANPPCCPAAQWVDYIDEFGRTRRCLRRDLPSQRRAAQEDPYRGQAPWGSGAATGHPGAAPDLMSADMRREREREEWEDQARQEVLHGPIHFETVRNEEIRTMGTGYYRFSTDEAERGEQMQTLNTLRDEVCSCCGAAFARTIAFALHPPSFLSCDGTR